VIVVALLKLLETSRLLAIKKIDAALVTKLRWHKF
jgi:hypothetical protein